MLCNKQGNRNRKHHDSCNPSGVKVVPTTHIYGRDTTYIISYLTKVLPSSRRYHDVCLFLTYKIRIMRANMIGVKYDSVTLEPLLIRSVLKALRCITKKHLIVIVGFRVGEALNYCIRFP
jgi:hypothetical protein